MTNPKYADLITLDRARELDQQHDKLVWIEAEFDTPSICTDEGERIACAIEDALTMLLV